MRTLSLATGVATLVFIPGVSAQTITPLVIEGDSIAGVGLVTGLESIAVTDSGEWLVEVDTDNTDTTIDGVMLKNGALLLREGSSITAPAGAFHNEWTSRSLRADGNAAFIHTLTGTTGTTDNGGVFVNAALVLQKGSTPLWAGWGAGTTHNGLSWANLNMNNQIFLRGNVLDPNTAQAADWFGSVMQLDSAFAPLSETVFVRGGDLLPGQSVPLVVNTVRSGQDNGVFNGLGHAIFGCDLDSAATTHPNDAVVYLWNGTTNVLLAQEGSPSPVAGRNWNDLISPEFAINDAGDYVIKDVLNAPTATDQLIAKNGAKFVQEGDSPAAIAPFLLTTFGNTPVSLTASGSVLWYGDWDNPTTTLDTGIFLDQTLLVQEGVTTVNAGGLSTFNALGNVGTSATAGQNGSMYVSPNGRFVIFTAQLTVGNRLGIFMLDRLTTGGFATSCFGDGTGTACPCGNSGSAGNGCANFNFASGGNLAASGTSSISADSLVLTASNVPGPGLFFQGTSSFNRTLGQTFGDGLLCAGGTIMRMGVVFPTGSSMSYPGGTTPAPISSFGPNTPGSLRHYQCWYRDSEPTFCTVDTFNLTNMVTIFWSN